MKVVETFWGAELCASLLVLQICKSVLDCWNVAFYSIKFKVLMTKLEKFKWQVGKQGIKRSLAYCAIKSYYYYNNKIINILNFHGWTCNKVWEGEKEKKRFWCSF